MSKEPSFSIKDMLTIVSVLTPKPIAPVAPIPTSQNYSGDHDLLTRLDTKVDNIQLDVTELKKGTNTYVNQTEHQELCKSSTDHENRIRTLEASMWKWVGVSSTIAATISVGVVILSRLLIK